ncbi:MAG: GAF domain-containing protein, partial [Thermodesulfobacteriota bacterium]
MAILSEYFLIGYSSLLLKDSQKDLLRVEAVYGMEKENHPSACSNRKGTIGKVLESKQPMAIHNLNLEPLYEKMVKEGKKTDRIYPPLLCVPLLANDTPFGVLTINSLYGVRDRFDEDFQF